MISENILSGLITGIVAPVVLYLIIYIKDQCTSKYRVISVGLGWSLNENTIRFTVENISKKFIHLKSVEIIVSNKHCCEVAISDFYLDNNLMPYNQK